MAIVNHKKSRNKSYVNELNNLIQQSKEEQTTSKGFIAYIKSDGSRGKIADWGNDCKKVDTKYRYGLSHNDYMTHSYTISFDSSRSLDAKKCQQFGEELVGHMFSGHNCVVCSFPGYINILVQNIRENERKAPRYMTDENGIVHPREYKAGELHHHGPRFTNAFILHVMEMTKEYGISQRVQDGKHIRNSKQNISSKKQHHDSLEQKICNAGYKTVNGTKKDSRYRGPQL